MSEIEYILFTATYDSLDQAELDFGYLKGLEYGREIRKLNAAMVTKNEKGRIHVHETTTDGKVAAVSGLVAGAIIGAIFPPAGIAVIGGALAGAAVLGIVAGTIGHFAGGISRHEMRQLGALLEEGQAAIIAVAEDAVARQVGSLLAHAQRQANHALDKGDVAAAVADIEKGLAEAKQAEEAEETEEAEEPEETKEAP